MVDVGGLQFRGIQRLLDEEDRAGEHVTDQLLKMVAAQINAGNAAVLVVGHGVIHTLEL